MMKLMKHKELRMSTACVSTPGDLGDLGPNDRTAEALPSTSSSSSRTGAARVDLQNGDNNGENFWGSSRRRTEKDFQATKAETEVIDSLDLERKHDMSSADLKAQKQQLPPSPLVEAVHRESNDVSCATGCGRSEEPPASATWRDRPRGMEQDAVAAEVDRARGSRGLGPQEDRDQPTSSDGGGDQQGSSKEGYPDWPHPRAVAGEPHGQRDHRDPQAEGHGCGISLGFGMHASK